MSAWKDSQKMKVDGPFSFLQVGALWTILDSKKWPTFINRFMVLNSVFNFDQNMWSLYWKWFNLLIFAMISKTLLSCTGLFWSTPTTTSGDFGEELKKWLAEWFDHDLTLESASESFQITFKWRSWRLKWLTLAERN